MQDGLEKFISNSYDVNCFELKYLVSPKKISDDFYTEILKKPIIIYVERDKLPSSLATKNIQKYLKYCIGIERMRELLYLKKLPQDQAEDIEVECVLIESDYHDIKKVNVLTDLINLDFMIKRKEDGGNSTAGKIDYKCIDEIFFSYYKDDSNKLFKKRGKYFTQNLLNLDLDDNRQKDATKKLKYAQKEFKFYSGPDQIKLEKYDIKNEIFIIECPICSKAHDVKMFGFKNPEEVNTQEYIDYDNILNRFNFNCDHKGTKYHDKYKKFSLKNDFNYSEKLLEDQYNKLFLYIYFSFEKVNEEIKYFGKDGIELQVNIDKAFKKETNDEK